MPHFCAGGSGDANGAGEHIYAVLQGKLIGRMN
jgi:hypothetical protein